MHFFDSVTMDGLMDGRTGDEKSQMEGRRVGRREGRWVGRRVGRRGRARSRDGQVVDPPSPPLFAYVRFGLTPSRKYVRFHPDPGIG